MKVLRINTVTSTGEKTEDRLITFHPLDPQTARPYLGDDGQPCVAVSLRPISPERYRRIVKECTEKKLSGSAGIQEQTDFELVRDECVCYAITGWKGFIGADDKPLPCIDVAKRAIDVSIKVAIQEYAMRAEPVEVTAASFRELTDVSPVAGGLG